MHSNRAQYNQPSPAMDYWDTAEGKFNLNYLLIQRFDFKDKTSSQHPWMVLHICLDLLLVLHSAPELLRLRQRFQTPTSIQITAALQKMTNRFCSIFIPDTHLGIQLWYMNTSPIFRPAMPIATNVIFWHSPRGTDIVQRVLIKQASRYTTDFSFDCILYKTVFHIWQQAWVRNEADMAITPTISIVLQCFNNLHDHFKFQAHGAVLTWRLTSNPYK